MQGLAEQAEAAATERAQLQQQVRDLELRQVVALSQQTVGGDVERLRSAQGLPSYEALQQELYAKQVCVPGTSSSIDQ